MATRYLGPAFDIHGGGLDLRFPHHENEQAQSHAAGDAFAQYWMHSAWVTQGGTKMSKSLGNGLLVEEVLRENEAAVLRLALAGVHYRSMIEWTSQTLVDAAATWERFSSFVHRDAERSGVLTTEEVRTAALPEAAVSAFDDDLNVSAALAVAHEQLREGNSALAAGRADQARSAAIAVRGILDVLGLDPASEQWETAVDDRSSAALAGLVDLQLAERAEARAARDFGRSDQIRDRLASVGIQVEDSATGARWSLADSVLNSTGGA